MKTIFTNHDVFAMTSELNDILINSFVDNIYDVDNKSIIIKFNVKLIDNDGYEKKLLYLKSGERFNLINQESFTPLETQSSFIKKLRIHLKDKRLEKIQQINYDRVIVFNFGLHNIILELYGKGNIIITDNEFTILHLLHPFVYEGHSDEMVKTGNKYPFHLATIDENAFNFSIDVIKDEFSKILSDKKENILTLLLRTKLNCFGPQLIKHCCELNNINPKEKVSNLDLIIDIKKFIDDLFFAKSYISKLGYTTIKGFYPIKYLDIKEEFIEHKSFSEAICEFFSKNIKHNKIDNKDNKLNDNIKNSINKQIEIHDELIDKYEKMVEFYENNVDVFRTLLNNLKKNINIDTSDIYKIINDNKKDKIVTVKIDNMEIDLDYTKDGFTNLSILYKKLKDIKGKKERSMDIIADIDKKIIKKEQQKIIMPEFFIKDRKEFWFEEYNWFISSENHLVILGKNASQNDEVVKKHLMPNEIWLHSDVPGSGSGIIKDTTNPSFSELEEAAIFVMTHTKAWEQHSPNNVIWVKGSQVVKKPELPKGSFYVYGKTNIIKQPKLELGITIMFKLHDIEELKAYGDETVEFAVPMIAPYRSINDNKFKLKIIPGTGKAGKSLKNIIIPSFLKVANEHESYVIKKIDNKYFQRVMINNINIITSKSK